MNKNLVMRFFCYGEKNIDEKQILMKNSICAKLKKNIGTDLKTQTVKTIKAQIVKKN